MLRRGPQVSILLSPSVVQYQAQCSMATKKKSRIEDLYAMFSPKKSNKKAFTKRVSPFDGKTALYHGKYPILSFGKAQHRELQSLWKLNQYSEALARFWTLHRIGKHPTPHTIEFMTEGCSKSGLSKEVPQMLNLLKRAFFTPTPATYSHLASGYLREGDLDSAQKAIVDIKIHYPDQLESIVQTPRLSGAFLDYYARNQLEEEFSSLFEQIKSFKFMIRDFDTFLNELSVDLLTSRTEELKELLLNRMNEYDTYDLLLYHFAKRGLSSDLERMIETIKEKEVIFDGEMYDSIILCHIKNDNIDAALNVLDQMRTENVKACLESYETILTACIEGNRHEEVERLLGDLAIVNVQVRNVDTIQKLASYFAKNNKPKQAKQFWYLSKSRSNSTPPTLTHNVINACVNVNLHADAIELFTSMQENNVVPLKETYDRIIDSCNQQSRVLQAKFYAAERSRVFN